MHKFKKVFAALTAFAMLATYVVTFTPQVKAATFNDVPEDSWFYEFVEALVDEEIVDTSFDNFRPSDTLNRAELVKLAVEATVGVSEDDLPSTPTFTDVPADAWYFSYVETASSEGIVEGYRDASGNLTGKFGPGDPVNRAAAMKIIVNAFGIEEDLEPAAPFTDVSEGAWYYSFITTAYNQSVVDGYKDASGNLTGKFGPGDAVTRAQIAKMIVNAWSPTERTSTSGNTGDDTSTTDTGTGSGTTDTGTGSGTTDTGTGSTTATSDVTFEASISPNGPSAASVPKNGYNVPYLSIDFTAGADEGVKVTSITLTREGLGSTSDFSSVKVYDGNLQVGSEKSLNSTTNDATFNFANSPIEIAAGTTKTIRVLADQATGATASNINKLTIISASDITAVGSDTGGTVTVSGSFPITGAPMTLTAASVGTLTYYVQPAASGASLYIGDEDKELSKITITGSGEDMDLSVITVKQTGSAGDDDVGNYELMQGGSVIAGPVNAVNDLVVFDLSDNPFFLEKGTTKVFSVRGDVFKGNNKTAAIDIYKNWQIEATGRVYGYGVNVAEDTSNSLTMSSYTRSITGGQLSFSLSSNTTVAGDMARGSRDHVFAVFNITTSGDAVNIKNLPIYLSGSGDASELSDVKLVHSGTVIAGPISFTASAHNSLTYYTDFTDDFTVPANTTYEVQLTADVSNTAGAGRYYTFALYGGSLTNGLELENVTSGDTITQNTTNVIGLSSNTSTVSGNSQTVATPSLTVTFAATPTTQSVVTNAQNIDIAGFNFKAGSAGDVRITGITLAASGTTASSAYQNVGRSCNLVRISGSTTATLNSTAQDLNASTRLFSGLDYTIPAGETHKIVARCTIGSAASNNDVLRLGVSSVDAEDEDGRAISVTALTGSTSYQVTVKAGGGLYVDVDSDTPTGRQVATGTQGVELSRFKFTATNIEPILIRKLRFTSAGSGNGGQPISTNDTIIKEIYLYEQGNATPIATGGFGSGTVAWEGLSIEVPKNGNKVVIVKADLQTIAAGATSGLTPRVVLHNYKNANATMSWNSTASDTAGDIEAVGKYSSVTLSNTGAVTGDRHLSGTTADSGSGGIIGTNPITVYKSLISVTTTSGTPTGAQTRSSDSKLAEFKITRTSNESEDALISSGAGSGFIILKVASSRNVIAMGTGGTAGTTFANWYLKESDGTLVDTVSTGSGVQYESTFNPTTSGALQTLYGNYAASGSGSIAYLKFQPSADLRIGADGKTLKLTTDTSTNISVPSGTTPKTTVSVSVSLGEAASGYSGSGSYIRWLDSDDSGLEKRVNWVYMPGITTVTIGDFYYQD